MKRLFARLLGGVQNRTKPDSDAGIEKKMGSESAVEVSIGEKQYQISSDDAYLKHIGGDFEPEMVQLFRCFISDDDIVLDIGANIGFTAILFGDLAQAVHAFEPSPTTFAFLQKNVERSGLENISCHNMGLGAEAGEFTLTFKADNRSGGFVSDQTETGGGFVNETIVVRALDEVVESLELPGMDFIKMDVEGFEGSVIRGAQQTLSTYQPAVVLELNHWCLNAFQRTSVPDFFDQLRATFPILYAIDGDSYLDLYDEGESFTVMYYHILHGRFHNIIGAFAKEQLDKFYGAYQQRFVE